MDNNDLPQTPAPAVEPATDDLQSQIASLRSLVNSMLVLLIIVSGTLNIFFWRQYKTSKTDLNALSQQAPAMIAEYNSKQGPIMDEFIKKITEYGRSHPDFAPIMTKYGLNQLKPATNALPGSFVPPAAKK